MTVKYLDSKRISGITADRTGSPEVPAVSGGWKELARTTLGSAGDTIDVSSIPDKRYYKILTSNIASGIIDSRFRLGNSTVDTGSNYARRSSENGGAEVTGVNNDSLLIPYGENGNTHFFGVHYICNISSEEKLLSGHTVDEYATGSGYAPARFENTGKWANTSNVIDVIRNYNAQSGSFDTGSEMVVLGWDETDTHTTNFWEELGSADWVSGSSLPTVSFTAKKYLWVQCFTSGGIGGDGANRVSIRVGNGSIDTGSNYAFRNSESGGADSTSASTDRFLTHTGHKKNYMNMFIVNNASNEKLVMYHTSEGSGTGAGSAPTRIEGVGKWANTTNQVNRISVFDYTGGNNFNGGTIKVWGSN